MENNSQHSQVSGRGSPTDDAEDIDISVVLPVYNEAGHLSHEISRIVSALQASPYRWELLVVDDGSSDGSGEVALGHEGVRLLTSARNQGVGSARRIGTLAARGRVVVWTDADMTYPNHEIPALVDALGDADQVVGARRSERGTLRALRVPMKWMVRRLASYLTRTSIPDLNSGFRAMRRAPALQFIDRLPDGFSCVTTITLAFLMNGYCVKYVPIAYESRAGESKFRWWADTRRYVLQVIRMMFSYDPLRVFVPLACVFGVAFAAKLGFDLLDKGLRVASNTLLLGLVTVGLVVLGLLADLVVQVSRPLRRVLPADITEVQTPARQHHVKAPTTMTEPRASVRAMARHDNVEAPMTMTEPTTETSPRVEASLKTVTEPETETVARVETVPRVEALSTAETEPESVTGPTTAAAPRVEALLTADAGSMIETRQ